VIVAEISTGVASFTPIGVTDMTLSANGARSLARNGTFYGQFPNCGSGVAFASDPVQAGWTAYAITVAGQSLTRYWVRLKWSANLSAIVRIRKMSLIPYQAAVDSQVFGNEWIDKTGFFPHIVYSRTNENGDHVVHDMGSIGVFDELSGGIYGTIAADIANDPHMLTLFGKKGWALMRTAQDDRPQLTAWPIIDTEGFVEFGFLDLNQLTAAQTPGVYKLNGFILDAENWHAKGHLYYRWDDGRPWTHLQFAEGYNEIACPSGAVGSMLRYIVGWTNLISQAPGNPRVNWIDIDLDQTEGKPRRYPRQSPVVS
jgi:hypothetical protein